MTDRSTISVVIPTFNRRERLHRVLLGLEQQTDGDFEVIVVSDGSTDGTDAYLKSDDTPVPVVAATQHNQGPAVARNRGVELASGDLVLFIDDDVVPEAGLVGAHRDAHVRHGSDVVVIGPMLNPDDHRMSPWIRWEQAMLEKQYVAMRRGDWEPTARQFYTGNASVLRHHVVEVGGFDPAFRRAEDVELAFRLADRGLRFVFEDGAVGRHYAERSFDSWRSAGYQYGRNDIVFARDLGRSSMIGLMCLFYDMRPWAMRRLIRWCAPRPRLATASSAGLRGVARASDALGVDVLARPALSAIYGIAYYRGVADEFQDLDELWRLYERSRRERS